MPRGCPGSFRWRTRGLLRLCLRVRRPRITHQDKQSRPCKTHCFFPRWSRHRDMTLCCGSHPLGLTVDRHSSVNSGARYAEDYVVTVFGLHLEAAGLHLAYVTQLALGHLVKRMLVTLTQFICGATRVMTTTRALCFRLLSSPSMRSSTGFTSSTSRYFVPSECAA